MALIVFDDVDTWPFKDLIIENMETIKLYFAEKNYLNRLQEENPWYRANPPSNKYQQTYNALIIKIETMLDEHTIEAFHCTRLTRQEILDIRNEGLTLLSRDLFDQKLGRALESGDLNLPSYWFLKKNELIRDKLANNWGTRTDLIWFLGNKQNLHSDPESICRFFQFWGGTALYYGLDISPDAAEKLPRIGQACIIRVILPIQDIYPYFSLNFATFFIRYLLDSTTDTVSSAYVLDIKIGQNVKSSEIVDIIEFSDPRFIELTDHQNWPEHYRIK